MSEQLEIVTTWVWPGGCSEIELGGKRRIVRVCVGYLEDPERGLLAEMDGSIPRTPWQSKEKRDAAVESIRQLAWIEEPMKTRLLEHVAKSPYFEVKQ